MSVARRAHHYHGGAKGKVINNTVKPAPAWQARNIPANASAAASTDPGSKILISNLPPDVGAEEIEVSAAFVARLRESHHIDDSSGLDEEDGRTCEHKGNDDVLQREGLSAGHSCCSIHARC